MADKTALKQIITKAQGLIETDYTTSSWATADIPSAIASAQDVYDDPDATQTQVDSAVAALQGQIDVLVPKTADKTALEEAIATAKNLKSSGILQKLGCHFSAF
jgi:hypothetical protein